MNPVAYPNKPTVSDESIDINSLLKVTYTHFKNEFTFTRPANAWAWFGWKELPFVPPVNNPELRNPYDGGVEFICREHVSVCVAGNAEYILAGTDGDLTYNWTIGTHNVENGVGYLPNGVFTRTFHNDFVLCCVLQKEEHKANDLTYNFNIVNQTETLSRDVEFIHVALGSINVNGTDYNQKQNIYNLTAGQVVTLSEGAIGIVGYTV